MSNRQEQRYACKYSVSTLYISTAEIWQEQRYTCKNSVSTVYICTAHISVGKLEREEIHLQILCKYTVHMYSPYAEIHLQVLCKYTVYVNSG